MNRRNLHTSVALGTCPCDAAEFENSSAATKVCYSEARRQWQGYGNRTSADNETGDVKNECKSHQPQNCYEGQSTMLVTKTSVKSIGKAQIRREARPSSFHRTPWPWEANMKDSVLLWSGLATPKEEGKYHFEIDLLSKDWANKGKGTEKRLQELTNLGNRVI